MTLTEIKELAAAYVAIAAEYDSHNWQSRPDELIAQLMQAKTALRVALHTHSRECNKSAYLDFAEFMRAHRAINTPREEFLEKCREYVALITDDAAYQERLETIEALEQEEREILSLESAELKANLAIAKATVRHDEAKAEVFANWIYQLFY